MKQVGEIIHQHITENNFDGLFNPSNECSCHANDLWPCEDGPLLDCEAGHKVPCPKDDICDCGQDHIGAVNALPMFREELQEEEELYGSQLLIAEVLD